MFRLSRRPWSAPPQGPRAWLLERVHQEARIRGHVRPTLYLFGDDTLDTLELDAVSTRDPGADLGVTLRQLRRREPGLRGFLVIRARGTTPAGPAPFEWAVILEERDTSEGPRWWAALLAHQRSASTGLGEVLGEWQQPPADLSNPLELPGFLVPLVIPPQGARAAAVHPLPEVWRATFAVACDELPPDAPTPAGVEQVMQQVVSLGLLDELVSGRVVGHVLWKLVGRSWEQWVYEEEMPSSAQAIARWLTNRDPVADAVAFLHVVVRPGDGPVVPGVRILAEADGEGLELWAPLTFPEGPHGRREVEALHTFGVHSVAPEDRWIGGVSGLELELDLPEA